MLALVLLGCGDDGTTGDDDPQTRSFECDSPISPPEQGYPVGYGGAY